MAGGLVILVGQAVDKDPFWHFCLYKRTILLDVITIENASTHSIDVDATSRPSDSAMTTGAGSPKSAWPNDLAIARERQRAKLADRRR
jgi:hypothetical protein